MIGGDTLLVEKTQTRLFRLDALEQTSHDRREVPLSRLILHSESRNQHLLMKRTERLTEAGIEPSVGSVEDSYGNDLAENITGLCKAKVIHRLGPWRRFKAVE